MDTIADMLTIIRNAVAVKLQTVYIPFSKMKFEIAKILTNEGFIDSFEKKGRKNKKVIQINMVYEKGIMITGLKRISKSSKRVFYKKSDLKPVLQGFGINIISTSEGLMTGKEARKKGLGGEVICEVW